MALDRISVFETSLGWKDAGTALLNDPAGLQYMLETWKSNVARMAERARARGWKCSAPQGHPGIPAARIQQMETEAQSGLAFPAQLGWALMQMGEWRFEWHTSEQDEPGGELSSCYAGGVRGTVWRADAIDELHGALLSWAGIHAARLIEEDEDDAAAGVLAFWRQHLAFHALPNGDMLALDLRHDDPQQQPVRYFSHEQDGLHGRSLAPDFFSFVSRWTALGCVGSDGWSWAPFTLDSEPDRSDLSPSSSLAQRWVAWLEEVPAHMTGLAVAPGVRPPRVLASSAADLALLTAAQANHLPGVEQALRDGAQPDCSDKEDRQHTAVMHAARHGNLGMLQVLEDHGASLATHHLPLAEVMNGAAAATLTWLVAHGARVDPWKDDRFCALHRLYERADLSDDEYLVLLDAMLGSGCDADAFHDTGSCNAKTTLLMRSGPITGRRLLAAGADALRRDAQGRTAMHYARDHEHVQLLLAHGLSVNDLAVSDDPSQIDRPLHFNLSGWSIEAPVERVSALLDAGADPAMPDGQGRNAWWHCRHLACAGLLAQKLPFNGIWRDSKGGSPVHHLVQWDSRLYEHSASLLHYWCEHGLDINAQDHQGDTSLHAMARCYDSIHDRPSMELLLSLGADWHIRNLQGRTPRDLIKKKHKADWK